MNRIVTASIATLAITSSAYAADINAPSVPYVASYSWTGFYVGGDVGADWAKSSGAWNPLDANGVLDPAYWGVNPLSGGISGTGAVAGGHLGFNYEFAHSWVAGVEGDWTWTGVKSSWSQHWTETIPTEGLRPGTHSTVSTAVDSFASIRARAGYLIMPSILLYGTGGFAWADVSYNDQAQNEMGANPNHSTPYSASYSQSKWVPGWVVGGGLEYALSNNWSLRGEYLFYRLNTANSATVGDSTGNFCATCTNPPFPSNFTHADTDVQAVRFGASYKF